MDYESGINKSFNQWVSFGFGIDWLLPEYLISGWFICRYGAVYIIYHEYWT